MKKTNLITITTEAYTRLTKMEALLGAVLNAPSYNRDSAVEAARSTVAAMQQEEKAAKAAKAAKTAARVWPL